MTGLAAQTFGLLLGIALAAAGLPVRTDSISARALVSSGHRGAVLDIAVDNEHGFLFSVGEDGFLRVWDSMAGTLLRRIAVTSQRAQSVALDPAAPLAAVVVTDGLHSFAVDVWDWDAGQFLYSIPLQSAPLFVRFSRSGSLLLSGDMRWNGLHICRSRDGTTVAFHPEGIGMVGFAEVSRNDATLLTYQPSGRLAYWDIASGKMIREAPTVEGLVNVNTSDDRSMLSGQSGSTLVGLDALSGETRFRVEAPGMTSMDISGDAAQVAWLLPDGSLEERSLVGSVPAVGKPVHEFDWQPRIVRLTRGGVVLGGDDGQIGAISSDGHAVQFAQDALARVSGVAARGRLLAVAAGKSIHVFETNPIAESFSVANPFPEPVGLAFLGGEKLIVWQQGDGRGLLGTLDLSARRFTGPDFTFAGPLAAVTAGDDVLITLQKNGVIQVLEPTTGAQLFQAAMPGALCVSSVGHDSVLIGRVSGGQLGSSIVRIDTRTGETSPLPGTATLTFALASDPAGGLYSLGVSPDGSTKLTRYQGTELQSAVVLDSAKGEFPSASLSIDPVNGFLYTSLGREVVKAWTGGSLQRLADPARGTLALCALQGLLASLQRDSSVSLWDTTADRAFGELYPFADGSWAAVMADGTIRGSPDGRKKVGILVNGRLWESGGRPATIDATGNVYVDGARTALSQLSPSLSATLRKRPNAAVIIMGDRDVRYDLVVRVLEIARTCGVNKLSLAVEVRK